MTDQRMYQLHKPLRNHLTKVGIENALFVLWAYLNYLQMNRKMPVDIETNPVVFEKEIGKRIFFEWELALLARQVIILGESYEPLARHSLQRWNYFYGAVRKLKDFENEAYRLYGGPSTILGHLRRISYQQFPWQLNKPSTSLFVRYYKIFSYPPLAKVIEAILGLNIQEWYTIGIAVMGGFLEHPRLNIDPEIKIGSFTIDQFNRFFNFVSSDLKTFQEIIREEVVLDETFVYAVNPLENKPLIQIGQYYFCPVTTFLTWRITSGIYYDLVDDSKFSNPYGQALNEYLYDVSEAILSGTNYKVYKEAPYGPHLGKDPVDLIVTDKISALFVESKALRRTKKLRSKLLADSEWVAEIERVAAAIAQIYATTHDYLQGEYKHFPLIRNLQIYPLVVSLEDLFIMGPEVIKQLNNRVIEIMKDKELPENYLERMPYLVCSIEDFERILQIIPTTGLPEFMSGAIADFQKGNSLGAYIFNTFKHLIKPLDHFFQNDFKNIFPEGIGAFVTEESEEEFEEDV